jgi:hypothetical protein
VLGLDIGRHAVYLTEIGQVRREGIRLAQLLRDFLKLKTKQTLSAPPDLPG